MRVHWGAGAYVHDRPERQPHLILRPASHPDKQFSFPYLLRRAPRIYSTYADHPFPFGYSRDVFSFFDIT